MSYENKIREYLQGIEYDPENRTLTADEGDNHVANIRGWSSIRKLFATDQEAGDFQDEMGKWIADAISRKLQDAAYPAPPTNRLMTPEEVAESAEIIRKAWEGIPPFVPFENTDIGGFDRLNEGGGAANGGESQALQAAIMGLHTLAGEFPTPTWKTREDYLQATISEINEILWKQ